MAGGAAQHTDGSKEEGRAGASELGFPFSLLSLSLKSFGVCSRNVTHSPVQGHPQNANTGICQKRKKKGCLKGFPSIWGEGSVSFRGCREVQVSGHSKSLYGESNDGGRTLLVSGMSAVLGPQGALT